MKNRRTTEGYKLRVYMSAIADAKAMSASEWVDSQAKCAEGFITQESWIHYLEQCALVEATKLIDYREAA